MFAPFKGYNDGLSRKGYHRHFVQNSVRMCVEQAFGMLKGRWQIFLKMMDFHLKSVPKLVMVCLVLHNMCIIFGDNF